MVAYSKQGIFISQRKYVLDLLKEKRKLGCKTLGVPIKQNHGVGWEESPTIEKSQYQRLVEKLIYLSHTRPYIAYAVSMINQFMHDPRERLYSDYVGSIMDRRSTSGYCMFLGGNLIILDDLKVKYKKLIKFFCDNNSAISIAYNLVQHDKTKHIEIDIHFIKEKLNNGLVVITHVSTGFQVVDIFTKGLLVARFQELNGKLGMIDIHLSTLRGSVRDIVNISLD
ncbi:Copia protein, partial [Mucuna pruriens]